jgi:hypothetical protein
MENAHNSQNLTSPDISSHSLFLENYLFVQTPPSKFDNLPNSASTPKTHKTIVKYNMEKLGTCRKLSGYPEENGTTDGCCHPILTYLSVKRSRKVSQSVL